MTPTAHPVFRHPFQALMLAPRLALLTVIWGALWLCSGPAFAADTLVVKGMELSRQDENHETLTLKLSEPAHAQIFTLENPNRLVIDLPSFRWKVKGPQQPSQLIRHLRYARFNEDTSRLVLDLTQPLQGFEITSPHESDTISIDLIGSSAQNATSPSPSNSSRPAPLALEKPNKLFPKATRNDTSAEEDNATEEEEAQPAPAISYPTSSKKISRQASTSGKLPLVMIDAGHGGKDPGCIGESGTHEKDITFRYAKALKEALEDTGRFRAALTRSTDSFIPLRGRTNLARKAKADIFISLHADTASGPDARGLSLYSLSLSGGDKEANALAARENKADIIDGVDLSGASADVADILIDMALHDSMQKSRKLGRSLIQSAKKQGVPLLSNPQREAAFAVLKIADIPSVLVELGFLSHPEEERLLKTQAHQDKIVAALVSGIDSFATTAK